MNFALVYYPRIEHKGFHCFRYRYEPYATLLPEHMPIVFPVDESIGLENLKSHIQNVLNNWSSFDVVFHGVGLSWDNWLLLEVKEGNELVHKLHKELHTGLLKPYQRQELPFIPHIAMGFFTKDLLTKKYDARANELDQLKYEKALLKADQMDLLFRRTMKELILVKLTDNFTKSWDIETFIL